MEKPTLSPTPADLIAAYWTSPGDSWHRQETISLVYGYSGSWLQSKRSHGGGPNFRKVGKIVLYRKADVEKWFEENGETVSSTSQYQTKAA